MTDDLYERYKESLRIGHVAVLRGSLPAAIDAYRSAAEIAPSRALPHTSLGGVLLRLGRLDEALVEYAAAVARGPYDEGALLGQAEALGAAGRRVDAAAALDEVAEIQAESGRLPEAADTLRRAMELAESPARASRQQELMTQTRRSAGDHAAEQLLARALRLRDEMPAPAVAFVAAVAAPASVPVRPDVSAEPEVAEASEPATVAEATEALEVGSSEAAEPTESGELVAELEPAVAGPVDEASPEPIEAVAAAGQAERPQAGSWDSWWRSDELPAPAVASAGEAAGEPVEPAVVEAEGAAAEPVGESIDLEAQAIEPVAAEAEPESARDLEPAEELVGVMTPAAEAEHVLSGDELLAAAEAAETSENAAELHSTLLAAARAYAREGRFEAALDAAQRLLRPDPSDVETHLVLVELYMARDWNVLAIEKLVLLERLARLSGDDAARRQVCVVAGSAYPGDERLGAACS